MIRSVDALELLSTKDSEYQLYWRLLVDSVEKGGFSQLIGY